jgi:hypothetical protein
MSFYHKSFAVHVLVKLPTHAITLIRLAVIDLEQAAL